VPAQPHCQLAAVVIGTPQKDGTFEAATVAPSNEPDEPRIANTAMMLPGVVNPAASAATTDTTDTRKMQSITIGRMFDLVEHIKDQIRIDMEEASGANSLEENSLNDITSHDLRKFFQKRLIHPKKRYSSYFSQEPPDIVLTYEWSTSFSQVRSFFKIECLRQDPVFIMYWRTICESTVRGANEHESERILVKWFIFMTCWMQFFGWGFSDLITSNDISNARIWVDIFFNDQNSIDILLELAEADQQYRKAPLHAVLGTRGLFTRAWCLHELMTRKLAGKPSVLLGVVGEHGKNISKISTSFTASLKWLMFGDHDHYNLMQAFSADDKAEIQKRIESTAGVGTFNHFVSRLVYEPYLNSLVIMMSGVLETILVALPLYYPCGQAGFALLLPLVALYALFLAGTMRILYTGTPGSEWVRLRMYLVLACRPLVSVVLIVASNASCDSRSSFAAIAYYIVGLLSIVLFLCRPAFG
jgi:hypothetical protein